MKEVQGTARNLMLALLPDNVAVPTAECILFLSEPRYGYEDAQQSKGKIQRETTTVRFACRIEHLRELAKTFSEWADELDVYCNKVKPESSEAK